MKATFLITIFFISILYVIPIRALDTTVVINELLPDAVGSDTGKEFVELYNDSSSEVNLKDWYFILASQTGTSKKIIIPEINIKSHAYFVVAEDLVGLGITNGISLGSGKLALTNDFAKLQLFNANAALIHEVNYGDSKEGVSWDLDGPKCNQLAYSSLTTPGVQNSNYRAECFTINSPTSYPEENISINKIEVSLDGSIWTDTLSTNINSQVYFRYVLNTDVAVESIIWKDALGNTLSNPYNFLISYKDKISLEILYKNKILKASSSIIDIHNSISNKVIITEVYPSPESPDKEWIEIYNNDSLDINLSNYFIEEKTTSGITNTRSKLKDQIIKPGEYYVLNEDEFNVSLNNSGDSIYLFDLYSNRVDLFIYSETDKSKSVGRKYIENTFSSETFECSTPTPLSANQFPSIVSEQTLQSYTLLDLPNLKSGTEFFTTVDVSNYIDKYIFINFEGIKLKAKLTQKITEDIINTTIRTKVKVTTSGGIKNLLINPDDIELVRFINPVYSLFDLKVVTELNVGDQYSIEGIITEVYSNRIKIDVNGKLLNIYTNDSFNADIAKGKKITVQGTLDYYRNSFRIIVSDYQIPQILSAENTSQTPLSFAQNQNKSLISQSSTEDNSKIYLITFGYVIIGVVFIMELIKSRKSIIKFLKSSINSINVFGRPVIKY